MDMHIDQEMRTAAALPPIALGVEAASRAVGISRSGLYSLIATGELKSIKAGGRRLILIDDLRAFLEAQREVA